HLPPTERVHFGQYKTAQSLYAAVVARYSSLATAALSRLMLPYLFPDLAAFTTVADLTAHLRTSDARYCAALPTEFCTKNPPPHVLLAATVAPLSLRGVPLSPFSPLLLLLLLSTLLALRRSELRLPLVGGAATARARGARVVEGTAGAAAEAVEEAEGVAVEVGVVQGVGTSVAAVEVVEAAAAVVEAAAAVVEVAAAVVLVEVQPRSVEALVVASASNSRVPVRPRRPSSFVSGTDFFLLLLLLLSTSLALRSSELRLPLVGGAATARARGARVVEGTAGAAAEAVEEAEGVAVEVGVVQGVGTSVAAVEVVEAAAAVVEAAAAVVEVAAAVVLVEVQPRSVEALVVASASNSRVPVRPRRPSSFVSGTLGVGALGFSDAVEFPRLHDLLRKNVAIFDLDFDAILAAMYALPDSAEGDCYLSVPPDPGIEAAALGASAPAAPGTGEFAAPGAGESALSGTAPTEALHTFTLDSGASHSFFRDSTTLTPLSRPVAVSLADPSGGPVLAHSSTVLPCPAAPSSLLSGLHLPSFSTNLVSGADLQDAW
ncbi:unnamed protein product, partial [Closterium sp. NIES-54]